MRNENVPGLHGFGKDQGEGRDLACSWHLVHLDAVVCQVNHHAGQRVQKVGHAHACQGVAQWAEPQGRDEEHQGQKGVPHNPRRYGNWIDNFSKVLMNHF